MWNFLLGFLFARATGISRFVRALLLLVLLGAVIVGFIYAAAVFKAANQRSNSDHVQRHSTR
jgi:general stress protein CsbA